MKNRTGFLLRSILLLVVVVAVPPLAAPAIAAGACHGTTSCPSPTSCGSWSTFYDCGQPFCAGDAFCEFKTGEDALYQPRERFRACVLANGSQCLEYQAGSAYRLHCRCF